MNAADLGIIAHALGGAKRDGQGWRARCPVHNSNDSNLSLHVGDTVSLVVKCWSHQCDPLHILAELRWRELLDDSRNRPGVYRRRDIPPPRPTKAVPTKDGQLDTETLQKIDGALNRTKPLKRSIGGHFLRHGRGLEPDLLDPEAVRFLPATDRYPPCLVSVITSFADAATMLGLQFSMLAPDGSRKLGRKFLTGSRPSGGVCRLVNDAEVTTDLAIGEGLETCLAAMTAQYRAGHLVRPTWAALSASNFNNLAPLPGIERLVVLVDADDAGRKGGGNLAMRWHQAGRQIYIAAPPATNDWNDQ